jgi:hypothetical protein
MARFPTENQFWRLRSKTGRDLLFATPQLLKEAAEEYFNWCDAHPLYKAEAIKSGDMAGTIMKVPVMRPYTMEGFLIYVDAGKEYWRQFNTERHPDFSGVLEWISQSIYNQKFSGAAANLLNANIIARDLGLRDNVGLSDGEGKPLASPILNITTVAPAIPIPESEEDA